MTIVIGYSVNNYTYYTYASYNAHYTTPHHYPVGRPHLPRLMPLAWLLGTFYGLPTSYPTLSNLESWRYYCEYQKKTHPTFGFLLARLYPYCSHLQIMTQNKSSRL